MIYDIVQAEFCHAPQLDSLEERMRLLIDEYAENFGSLPEKTAGKILEECILIERDRQKFREYYLTKFRNSSLPRKRIARYFQLENKIQAVQNYELASKIPLVREHPRLRRTLPPGVGLRSEWPAKSG